MPNGHLHIAIMAGGAGVRFWPASTERQPKQFLDILGLGATLLQTTYQRACRLAAPQRIWVVTSAAYAHLVRQQLPDLPPDNLLLEPLRRNTAPCLAFAAQTIAALDPEAVMLVVPSDHLITQEEQYDSALMAGVEFAMHHRALVTYGIAPHSPATGYGYIELGDPVPTDSTPIARVARFKEKPDLETAQAFLASGNHLWNAGIFAWRVDAFLTALEQYEPRIAEAFAPLAHTTTPAARTQALETAYDCTPAISVDYAILEKADNVYVVRGTFGWSDLGSWGSVARHSAHDGHGNACIGRVLTRNTTGSLIRVPQGKLAVVHGLEGYLVAQTEDVLLICPLSDDQQVREIVDSIGAQGWQEFL